MTFDVLQLKETYDSDEDDILNDFYIPVLSGAVRYCRLAGYFSSASLAASAKGMAKFLQNGGKMQMVTSVQISEEDSRAILDGLTQPDEVISKIMQKNLDEADQLQKDHVSALSWMIAKKSLEIKVAIPLARDGKYYTKDLDRNSIYHQKIGILYDVADNIISFSGSVNETAKAWNDNIEEFKVFCSWKPGQDVYGSNDARKFEKFWHNHSDNTRVIDLPAAVRERLIKNAPKTETDAMGRIRGVYAPLDLRDYQNEAIQKWFDNRMHGVFAMATGTGKTHTAIACIKKICDDSEHNLIVVTCPYKHLVTQWSDALKKWGIEAVKVYGSSAQWRDNIGDQVRHLYNKILKNLVIVTTHDTFAREPFMDIIRSSGNRTFLVADEVHKLGAEKRSEGLLESYGIRLGLSATPERYFDEAGTKKILGYFGGIVYEFGLDRAIKQDYLVKYELYPHIVYMNDDESFEYHKFSRHIAIEASKNKPDREKIKQMSLKRANIIKTARDKLAKFRDILKENDGTLDHCLVYCVGGQLDEAASVLHDMHVIFHRFTFKEDPEEREKLLKEFENGNQDVLLAIKCLDEGVDVPSIKTAIILASSNNPIEFIQRRGRILRKSPGKDRAVIHDLIVLPKHLPTDKIYTELEKSVIQKELDRLAEFASSSDNPEYSTNLIQTVMKEYDLS